MIIAISGKKFSGKDTAAKMIIEHLYEHEGMLFCRHSFADKVKEVVELLTGIKRTKVDKICGVDILDFTR